MSQRPELRRPDPSLLLIIQLHQLQAMLHLGLIPNPATGQPGPPNLDGARFELALLEILEEKTRGNLDAEEERFLLEIIAALRMSLDSAAGG